MLRKKTAVPEEALNPAGAEGKFTADKNASMPSPAKKAVRRIISVLLIILLILGCIWAYIQYVQTHFTVSFYNISTGKVSEEFRIVFLADLHDREYGSANCELLEDVEELSPDIIICGGDMVTYGQENFEPMSELYAALSEIAPTYAIMGNHEDAMIFLENKTRIPDLIFSAGAEVLRNQLKEVSVNGNTLEIIGISGGPEQYELYGGRALMENLPPESSKFRILICHVPIVFPECLAEYDFDLGLAGHNHGGIIKLPKLGPLYSCEEGFFPEYAYGMKNIEGKPLIVSGGLGDSNPIPRINNSPEIVVVDVNCY